MDRNAETNPLDTIPPFEFWRDGLISMKRNAIVLLELAGEPVTVHNILRWW